MFLGPFWGVKKGLKTPKNAVLHVFANLKILCTKKRVFRDLVIPRRFFCEDAKAWCATRIRPRFFPFFLALFHFLLLSYDRIVFGRFFNCVLCTQLRNITQFRAFRFFNFWVSLKCWVVRHPPESPKRAFFQKDRKALNIFTVDVLFFDYDS